MCIYNNKMCVYIYIYVFGSCLDKYISAATWPPKQKFLTLPLYALPNKREI